MVSKEFLVRELRTLQGPGTKEIKTRLRKRKVQMLPLSPGETRVG